MNGNRVKALWKEGKPAVQVEKTSLSIVHDFTCRSFKQQNKFHEKTFMVFRIV